MKIKKKNVPSQARLPCVQNNELKENRKKKRTMQRQVVGPLTREGRRHAARGTTPEKYTNVEYQTNARKASLPPLTLSLSSESFVCVFFPPCVYTLKGLRLGGRRDKRYTRVLIIIIISFFGRVIRGSLRACLYARVPSPLSGSERERIVRRDWLATGKSERSRGREILEKHMSLPELFIFFFNSLQLFFIFEV